MKKNTLLKSLGSSIRDARKKKGLTQEELAEKADVNPKFLGKVERAETNISLVMLSKVCDGLGVSLCEVLAFTAMDKKMLKLGDLGTEFWKLVQHKDTEVMRLSVQVFKDILQGIEKLDKKKS